MLQREIGPVLWLADAEAGEGWGALRQADPRAIGHGAIVEAVALGEPVTARGPRGGSCARSSSTR